MFREAGEIFLELEQQKPGDRSPGVWIFPNKTAIHIRARTHWNNGRDILMVKFHLKKCSM